MFLILILIISQFYCFTFNSTIIQWNINGLQKRMHLGEIQRLLKEYEPMCICLQHTNTPIPSIGKYFLATASTPGAGLLGTAIYVHNRLTYDKIAVNNTFQTLAIKLHLPNKKNIVMCNMYNQPSQNYDMRQLSNILSQFQQPVLIMGDFNAHHPLWDFNITDADAEGEEIEQLLLNQNYCCLNEDDVHTYISKTHGSLSSIDLTLCSAHLVEYCEWNVLDDLYTSDHYPIVLTYLHDFPQSSTPKFNFNKANWKKYEVLTKHISHFQDTIEHNEINSYFSNFIIDAANESIPKSTYNPNKRTVPWWNTDLSEMIKLKYKLSRRIDRLNQRFKKLNNVNNKTLKSLVLIAVELDCIKPLLNKISATFRKRILENRRSSWNDYISNFSNDTTKQFWDKYRKINGNFIRAPRSPILHNGKRIHDTSEISNIIGHHLESIGNSLNLDNHFRERKRNHEKIILNFETSQQLLYNMPFSMIEFEAALKSSNNSTPGKDEISFNLIKHLHIIAKEFLLSFYNHLWKKGLFPKAWRHAIVIAIPKPGKDPSLVNNYRPISLTSCLCKLMEKMVNNRLVWYLEKNNILSETQSGSRKNRSTLNSLASLEDQIKRGFTQKKITVAVFFDIQKAYDTTWRYSILRSLYNNNFRGELPIFIRNFLTQRTFQTKVDNNLSKTFEIKEGIPQGSVLSGTLFALAINDIVKSLPKGVNNSLYVDDFAIFYTSSNLRHIQRILNLSINKIEKWASSVGFNFSVEKTKAILFYRDKRWLKNQNIDLVMFNSHIRFYTEVKFLGLYFDCHMNWKTHIKHTKAKALKALNLLKKLAHTSWGANRDTLLRLYKATVLPILEYGSPIYSSASRSVLKMLDPIHHLGLRLASGAFKSSPTPSLIAESGDLPLNQRFQMITMRRALKLKNIPSVNQNFQKPDCFLNTKISPSFPVRASRLFENNNIRNIRFYNFKTDIPPWKIGTPQICSKLYNMSKMKQDTPLHLKQSAIEHINEHRGHHMLYTDGSKTQEGVGFAVYGENLIIQHSLPSWATVYTAELLAIKYALDAVSVHKLNNVIIFSDSQSSLEAVKTYTPQNKLVSEIQYMLYKLKQSNISVSLCWVPSHIGIGGNENADKYAKEATSLPCSINYLPTEDYLSHIKSVVKQNWQNEWNRIENNKLRDIKETTRLWSSTFQKIRREEVILARLRIGHCKLTHGYLMSTPHDPPPICDECNILITVKHILVECPKFSQQRNIIFKSYSIQDILAENQHFSTFRIFKFLRFYDLFNKI